MQLYSHDDDDGEASCECKARTPERERERDRFAPINEAQLAANAWFLRRTLRWGVGADGGRGYDADGAFLRETIFIYGEMLRFRGG